VGEAAAPEEAPQVHLGRRALPVHRARQDPQVRVVRPARLGRRLGPPVVRAAAVGPAADRAAAGTLVAARSDVEEW
jgi:hypothetical protein